ncbi:MAG: ABC transporter permease [Crocinitomicaceae bacterium]|nr:ABC transporter permease [Crocinitomicaceae bacterium]
MSEELHIISSKDDTFKSFITKIWNFKTLIWVFAKRDLKVKYSQTFIGLGWTVLQPLTALLIFTFFFGFLLNWETEGIPYPIYVLSGLLGWNFFSYIVSAGANGLQESQHLIKKIYFPKSIIPLSKAIIALIELGISMVLLILLMLYYHQGISWKILLLPLIISYNTILALCFVYWISILSLKKRDILHLIPFMLYFGIWFSPVFFSNTLLPEQYRYLLDYNPIANVVEMWRWSLFGYGEFKLIWVFNALIICVIFTIGLFYYNKKEGVFADNI